MAGSNFPFEVTIFPGRVGACMEFCDMKDHRPDARSSLYFFTIILLCLAESCSKGNNTPQPPPAASDTIYNRVITVSNFVGDTSSLTAPDASRSTILYSLEKNAGVPSLYAQTNRWDVSFSGIFNSFLGGNNGTEAGNAGSGGPGTGGVAILSQNFDSVNSVPPGLSFSRAAQAVGTDDAGAFGQGTGWYVYDWAGTLYYTSSICHALGIGGRDTTSAATQAHTAWARPDRTILVRMANGSYAKVRMISIYKNAIPGPVTGTPAPYLSFQYVLARPGSTDLSAH